MPLHLLKLCVGAGSIADLEDFIETRRAACLDAKEPVEHAHVTRMAPKRIDEILDGGALYWVIKGQIAARQALLDIRPFTDTDGISRCRLVMSPEVVPVMPRPCRPFQGWRYLAHDRRPDDLAGGAGAMGSRADAAEMPEHLRFALRELCLI